MTDDDGYQHGDDAKCYECGHVLTIAEQDRDKCSVCGRHYHDDMEDYKGGDDD
jgi:DNA-directed RNA polymerase subunit RPC12/RpoP